MCIFFGINSSPFASSWHLGKPLKGSAIQKGPTSNIFKRGRDGQLNKGVNSNCMESRRKENFSEASAVHKGEFLNFFNVGVEEVNPFEQSATVTRMRSKSCEILRESKCGDSRRAKTAWCQLAGHVLQCWPTGDGSSHKVNSMFWNTVERLPGC